MPSPTADLLDALAAHDRTEERPWGLMRWLDAPEGDLTVKYLTVKQGKRTSLQRHDRKDELLIIIGGAGYVEADGELRGSGCVRIKPGVLHRVTGPLTYIEVSTYDDDADTVRLADDYARLT
jgi:mannose-6-phosphate isomerase-like protein (cupin superfamily)